MLLEQEEKTKRERLEQEEKARREREQLTAELERAKLDAEMSMLMAEENALAEFDAGKQPVTKKTGYEPPFSLDEFLRAASNSAANADNKQQELQTADGAATDMPAPQQKSTKQAAAPTPLEEQVPASSILLQQQMLDLMSLPKPQLIQFDGDPLNFHVFLSMFDSCVHNSNISQSAKLNRLFELCQGKALRLIKPCALMAPDQGYIRARELLNERFGDDFEITEAYVKKIVAGPPIKGNNITALQEFRDDVRSCTETLRAMGKLDEVDTRSRLVRLVERLPYFLQNRRRKEAVTTRENTGSYPDID